MSNIPTPRSFSQIVSDMLDTFLARTGLTSLKIGPILGILEAAAQSDLRSTQDVWNALQVNSVDNLSGDDLQTLAKDEDVLIISAQAASGNVNFGDSSFQKIQTTVFQGAAAPVPGTVSLWVVNAANFPTTGSVYLSRGTINYEGPIPYTSAVNSGLYWTVTLSSPTTKFHNTGDTVILAQGGNRNIPSGTIVQIPQSPTTFSSVQFSTLYNAVLQDGENLITNVLVVCQTSGSIGNAAIGAINQVLSKPFNSITVTNPSAFSNGFDTESDDSLKERIKNSRASKTQGTGLAITTGIQGIFSSTDNKTLVSSSLVTTPNEPTTLYIDDGTGYQETVAGVAQEIVMDSATGGEQLFQLAAPRPVAKAFLTTNSIAPFSLTAGSTLTVLVGGLASTHTFVSSQFSAIGNATAFEVVASINSDSTLLYGARLSNNSTTVTIYAKSDVNEDLQVITPSSGIDANLALEFPISKVYTLRLFKNDKLLYKDGLSASLASNAQSLWSNTITNGDTLTIQVDGTAAQSITVSNTDFITENTGYITVSASNSLVAWAAVLNTKVAGATFSATGNQLEVTSNLGPNSRAALSISGGTLVSKGMFTLSSVTGLNNDYTLNRNLSQLKLSTPLVAGDQVVAASSFTRGYIQTPSISTATIVYSSTANYWFVVDGNAQIIPTGVNGSNVLTLTSLATNRARYTSTVNGTFSNILVGDWVIIWDPAFTDKGQFVVSDYDTVNFTWFEVERLTVNTQAVAPTNSGIVFVRTNKVPVQNIQISAGTYSLSSLASSFNNSLIGATASTYRTTQFRVTTNTYGSNGNLMLVTSDLNGQILPLPSANEATNSPSHFAIIESAASESGTPKFFWTTISNIISLNNFNLTDSTSAIEMLSSNTMKFKKRLNVPSGNRRYGRDAYSRAQISSVNGGNISIRQSTLTDEQLVNDRVYAAIPFGMGWDDTLNIVLDSDPINKSYGINMFRNIIPLSGATYGNSLFTVLDADNADNALGEAFGITNNNLFNDFSVFMHARGKSYSTTANTTILWRYFRYGSEGNNANVSFINPVGPSQNLAISTVDSDGAAYGNVRVTLPSGSARSGLNINSSDLFVSTSYHEYTATTGNVTRTSNVVTVVLSTTATQNCHTLNVGDNIYQITDQTGAGHIFRKGPKNVTAVTATSFSYNESGTNDTSNAPISYRTSQLPAGTSYTVTSLVSSGSTITATIGSHVFLAGEIVYFEPGHYDPTSNVTVAPDSKVLTSVGATTVTWNESTTAATASLISGVNYTLSSDSGSRVTYVYYRGEVAVGGLSRSGSGVVTATFQNTPIINNAAPPFAVGGIVYVSPGETNFPAGPKVVTSVSANTLTYSEAGTATTSTSTEFLTPNSVDVNFTGGGNPVVVGDISNVLSPANVFGFDIYNISQNPLTGQPHRVNTVTSTRYSVLYYTPSGPPLSPPDFAVPFPILNSNNLLFYPLTSPSASSIVSFVNSALNSPVTAVLVPNNGGSSNTGAGTITEATIEDYLLTINNASVNGANAQSLFEWPFFDGLNSVLATNLPILTTSQIQLKDTVSGELTSNNDFNNEKLRLVPTTAVNMVNYLSNNAVSSLGNNAIITTSTDGAKLQLGSQTIGSGGSIQISGGSANLAAVPIIGSGSILTTANGNFPTVTVSASEIQGLTGDLMVSLQGNKSTKPTTWTSTNTLAISTTGANPGEFLIQFDPSVVAVNQLQVISQATTYQIEKQGNYVAYIDDSSSPTSISTNIRNGDWVYINSASLNPNNTGWFQIRRINYNKNTFWVENAAVVEQVAATTFGTDYIKFISLASAVPGDTFTINTPILGAGNVDSFTVSRIKESGSSTTQYEFYVLGNLTTVSATTLGTAASLISLTEGTPLKLIKKINTIIPNNANAANVDIIFSWDNTSNELNYFTRMTAQNDVIIKALDKFGYNLNINSGLDGYDYNTGLLALVNRVAYGDETDPITYPGIIASGADINISGPSILRVQVSLAIRARTGVNIEDLINRVQSAVTLVINQNDVGVSIPISNIVSAANSVDGVLAVSMISPTYNSSSDLIVVQANEKTLVINVNQDVTVSIVGM